MKAQIQSYLEAEKKHWANNQALVPLNNFHLYLIQSHFEKVFHPRTNKVYNLGSFKFVSNREGHKYLGSKIRALHVLMSIYLKI